MATDITVTRLGGVVAEDRSWTIHEHGHDAPDHGVIDWTLFSDARFTDTGMIRSGCLLGRVTATGKVGPFDESATDGRQTAIGALFNTEKIPADTSQVSSVAWLDHFICRINRMPYGTTGIGALTEKARTDLSHVLFRGKVA